MFKGFVDFFNCNEVFPFTFFFFIFGSYYNSISTLADWMDKSITHINDVIAIINFEFLFRNAQVFPTSLIVLVGSIKLYDIFSEFCHAWDWYTIYNRNTFYLCINSKSKNFYFIFIGLLQHYIFSQHPSSSQSSRFASHSPVSGSYNPDSKHAPTHQLLNYAYIILNKGVSPKGASISWLASSKTRRDRETLSKASQPQPEPWIGTVFLVITSSKFSKELNWLTTAFENAPSLFGYSPPPLPMGARFSQYIEWLMCPPKLNLMVFDKATILL